MSQAHLDWAGLDKTSIRYGRQIAKLNNLRVRGDVNFRQTPQTFDAFSITNAGLPDADLYATYLSSQITTQGTQFNTHTPVINVLYSF